MHRTIVKRWMSGLVLAGLLSATAALHAAEKKFTPVKPASGHQSLMFDVNTPQVTKVWIKVLDGTAIINTVKIMGGEEFKVGARFEKDQIWVKEISARNVGQLRVNVDKAENSRIHLRVFYKK